MLHFCSNKNNIISFESANDFKNSSNESLNIRITRKAKITISIEYSRTLSLIRRPLSACPHFYPRIYTDPRVPFKANSKPNFLAFKC